MDDALTHRELDVLAIVLRMLERLDPAGARANEFGLGLVGRLRVLPRAEPGSPYREQARPSVPLSLDDWGVCRRHAYDAVPDHDAFKWFVQSVQRPEAQAIIFALAWEAAEHCALTPSELEFLTMLEREWKLTID